MRGVGAGISPSDRIVTTSQLLLKKTPIETND